MDTGKIKVDMKHVSFWSSGNKLLDKIIVCIIIGAILICVVALFVIVL